MVSRNFISNACIFNVGGFLQWGNSGWGAPDSCSQVDSFAQRCTSYWVATRTAINIETKSLSTNHHKKRSINGHHKICGRPHLLHGVNSYWLLCEGTLHLQNLVSKHSNQPKEYIYYRVIKKIWMLARVHCTLSMLYIPRYAVLDMGTNYCNLRNLVDGSGWEHIFL